MRIVKHREVVGNLLKITQLVNLGLISKSMTCLSPFTSSSDPSCYRDLVSYIHLSPYYIFVDQMVVRWILPLHRYLYSV